PRRQRLALPEPPSLALVTVAVGLAPVGHPFLVAAEPGRPAAARVGGGHARRPALPAPLRRPAVAVRVRAAPVIPVPVVAALVPDEPAVAAHRSIAWDPGQAIALAGAQAALPERLPTPVLERGSRSGAALLARVAALFPVTALRTVGALLVAGAPALRLKPLV